MKTTDFIDITMVGCANQLGLKQHSLNHSTILFSIANTKYWDIAAVEKLVYCLCLGGQIDFNYQNEMGNTFFHELILNQRSCQDVTKILKIVCENEKQFNVNIQNLEGDTFLHTALKSKFSYVMEIEPVLQLVMKKGFILNIKNKDDKTVYDCIRDFQSQMLQSTIRATKYLKRAQKGREAISQFMEEPLIETSELEFVLFKEELGKQKKKGKRN